MVPALQLTFVWLVLKVTAEGCVIVTDWAEARQRFESLTTTLYVPAIRLEKTFDD